MNFQPLIDNLPMILVGIGLLLWGWARLTEAKAKSNPENDWWDKQAPRAVWANQMYSQAIDWLCDAGIVKWGGQEKLKQLKAKVAEFEKQVESGDYLAAVAEVVGFVQDAKSKAGRAGKRVPTLPLGPRITPSSQGDSETIGPDSPAQE